jgi:hypothetical protein
LLPPDFSTKFGIQDHIDLILPFILDSRVELTSFAFKWACLKSEVHMSIHNVLAKCLVQVEIVPATMDFV